MKRVLLTGASGSIGAQVIAHFLEKTDWEIVALCSFHHKGYKSRLLQLEKDYPDYKNRVTELQHDLTAPIAPKLQEQIGRVDYILHLAALSDVFYSIDNPVHVIKNNVEVTLSILEYARMIKPKMFVYFSTDESLGPVHPEEAHAEGDPHRPSNAYAASKAACEDFCYSYWRSYGLPIVITRTMNNESPMQSSSKFPVMVQNWLNNGETTIVHGNDKAIGTRFYINSRNTADALLFILINKPAHVHEIGEVDELDVYHIVGDRAVSNLELAQIIAKLMGKKLVYEVVDFHKDNPGHDISYGLQDNKLRPGGWVPPLSLERGLQYTVEWQQKHPEWMR